MKETFDSVLNSVKDRFTNPFLGTFLFVWLVRNWSLIYGLFIFDNDCNMDYKLNYVRDHFKNYRVLEEFTTNLLLSLGLLILIYLSLSLFQYIANVYHWGIKKINSRFDKIDIESKTHYLSLNEQFKILTAKYKDLDTKSNEQLTDLQVKETDILELKSKQADFNLSIRHSTNNFLNCFPYKTLLTNTEVDSLPILEHYDFIDNSKKWISEKELSLLYISRISLFFIEFPEGIFEKCLERRYLGGMLSDSNLEEIKKNEYYDRLSQLDEILSEINSKEKEAYNDIINLFELFKRTGNYSVTPLGLLVLKELFQY